MMSSNSNNQRNEQNPAGSRGVSNAAESSKPLSQSRGFQPQMLVALVVLLSVLFMIVFGIHNFSNRVDERQAAYLEQCVTRSAIQCYVIEGRFPSTEEGVAYLVDNYGLQIDRKRYVVYYESIADNILPQIRVIVIPDNQHNDDIDRLLGADNQQPGPKNNLVDDSIELEP